MYDLLELLAMDRQLDEATERALASLKNTCIQCGRPANGPLCDACLLEGLDDA